MKTKKSKVAKKKNLKNLILTQEEVIENQIEWKLNRINLQNNCVLLVNLVSYGFFF